MVSAMGWDAIPYSSAPQGLEVSSRGQRPRKLSLPSPPSPLPAGGERGAEGGVWGFVRGFHPRLLNLLPFGERGFPKMKSTRYCSKPKSTELRGFSITFPSVSRV